MLYGPSARQIVVDRFVAATITGEIGLISPRWPSSQAARGYRLRRCERACALRGVARLDIDQDRLADAARRRPRKAP